MSVGPDQKQKVECNGTEEKLYMVTERPWSADAVSPQVVGTEPVVLASSDPVGVSPPQAWVGQRINVTSWRTRATLGSSVHSLAS